MLAQLTACVVNFSMAHPKKPLDARDFMPSEWSKRKPADKPKRRPRRLIADELRANIETFMKEKPNGR